MRFFAPRRPIVQIAPRDPIQYDDVRRGGPEYDRSRGPTSRTFNAFRQPVAAALTLTPAWRYVVPLGRGARVELMRAFVRNNSATALNGLVLVNITITPLNGEAATLLQATMLAGETTVARNEHAPQSGTILAGTIVEAGFIVSNNAAGTDVAVQATALFTEFDT